MTLGWKSIFLLGHSLISTPFFPLSTGSSIYYSTRRSRIWDDRGIERRREKMVGDRLYLSLSDRFVSKRVDDLGIVKRTAKYNERTRRFDGSRSFWSGIILTRDVWSKTFLFLFLSFFILFHIFLVFLEYEYLVWFRFKAQIKLNIGLEYKSIFENKLWT